MAFIRRRTRKAIRNEYEGAAHGLAWTPIVAVHTAVAIVLVACAVWLAIWLTTASSAARGNAAVTRQHNSGQNQVAQNTTLLNASAVVVSDQQKIKVLASSVVTEQDRMDLAGLEQNCAADVQAYNADVQNILATGLLPVGLPSSYPATVCDAPSS